LECKIKTPDDNVLYIFNIGESHKGLDYKDIELDINIDTITTRSITRKKIDFINNEITNIKNNIIKNEPRPGDEEKLFNVLSDFFENYMRYNYTNKISYIVPYRINRAIHEYTNTICNNSIRRENIYRPSECSYIMGGNGNIVSILIILIIFIIIYLLYSIFATLYKTFTKHKHYT
jgi:hypothetical protein